MPDSGINYNYLLFMLGALVLASIIGIVALAILDKDAAPILEYIVVGGLGGFIGAIRPNGREAHNIPLTRR